MLQSTSFRAVFCNNGRVIPDYYDDTVTDTISDTDLKHSDFNIYHQNCTDVGLLITSKLK